jgi:hypothetical protein
MTSLISSSLNTTITNEALLPTANGSSSTASSSTHDPFIIRVLSSWVNTRLDTQAIGRFDMDFRDGACLNSLMARLQQDHQPPTTTTTTTTTRSENNGSTHQDHLSDVARIIDALVENDQDMTTTSTAAVEELEYSIRKGHVGVTLELVSCIILNLSIKCILADEHVTTWTNQVRSKKGICVYNK